MMRAGHISAILWFLFLSIFFVTDLAAQSGGYAGSFTRMGFSPRGMAMGNALTAVESEGIYGYYNPALAAKPSESIQIDLSTAALRFDRQLHMVSSHFRLPPSAGFSVSLINATVSNIDGRTQSGYHTEYFSTNEFQLTGNFALRFSEKIWGGIGLKYNFINLHPEIPNSSSIGIDAGVLLHITSKLAMGVTIRDFLATQNLNTSNLYGIETGDQSHRYPVRFHSALSYKLTDSWLLSFDYEIRFQSEEMIRKISEDSSGFEPFRTIRENRSSNSQFMRMGTRYLIHDRITLRGGIQYLQFEDEYIFQPSAGFSLHLPYDRFSPSIDYAFVREPSLRSAMHVFAIRMNI